MFWQSISKDNITTLYGKTEKSRIAAPSNPARVFIWLICESYDDKGNVISYDYKAEDGERNFGNQQGKNMPLAHEANRTDKTRSANRYLKRIRYGNHTPYFPKLKENTPLPMPPGDGNWFFEVVFDYGEHDVNAPQSSDDPATSNSIPWPVRNDPFSTYRADFGH